MPAEWGLSPLIPAKQFGTLKTEHSGCLLRSGQLSWRSKGPLRPAHRQFGRRWILRSQRKSGSVKLRCGMASLGEWLVWAVNATRTSCLICWGHVLGVKVGIAETSEGMAMLI